MISSVDYLKIIDEAYDLSDPEIRKQMIFCNEAQKISNIENLTNKLYNHIRKNVDQIDFGTIPQSKGDISKVENYDNLVDCIDIIHKMIVEYREKTDIVDQLSTAIENVRSRQRTFEKAFALNIEFPIMTYNATVLSVVSSVSLLILTCIEYIKNGKDDFTIAFDKASYTKTRDHVLYQYVVGFNNSCKDGTLDKLMATTIKSNMVVKEDLMTIASTIGAIWAIGSAVVSMFNGASIIHNILYPIRALIYYWKNTRAKFSDWLSVQADFLQINAENLQYREDRKGSDDHRNKVYNKQMKWVDRLRKLSNVFALKDSKARKAAKDEAEDDDKRRPNEDNNGNDNGNGSSDGSSDGGLF